MGNDFTATLELTGNTLSLVNKEHHDVVNRLLEMDLERGAFKLSPERDHFIIKHFDALYLNGGAGKPIKHDALSVFSSEHFTEQNIHHFAITYHVTFRLECLHFGGVKQCAYNDGLR